MCPSEVLVPGVVEDFGGIALAASGLLGTVDLDRFLAIAEAMAGAIAEMHERGLVNQPIDPGSILIRLDDLQVQLSDRGLATARAEQPPGFGHPQHRPSDPAYQAPEQTGRMHRPIDDRTDLYALGATLYALATGQPPFVDTDPLVLVHAHLARFPTPPGDRASWLPPRLSELILTLLAKEPADRYQSAAGLAHDLRQLRQARAGRVPLEQITLRTRDLPRSPRPPHRLYGRERALATLLETYAKVTRGGMQALFIAGYAGVGKTALIREIQRPVTLGRGLFVSGKFEQFQRDRPFLAVAQCLGQLCEWLLAEPDERLAERRERMLTGLGPDAGALFEVIPELATLLGPQPPAPALGPLETRVRLRALLVCLIRQAASPAQPLVVLLDDLQWADQPSLALIGALLEDPGLDGLLLIGAFRDNEVAPAHPLGPLLQRPMAAGTAPPVVTLTNLGVCDLAGLLADMLCTSPAEVQPLALALHAKTDGNPFFTIALLEALTREGVIHADREQGRWRWDTAAIQVRPASDNVVHVLIAGLSLLETATLEVLIAAACLGTECTLGRLALATDQAPTRLADRLLPALGRGILLAADTFAVQVGDPASRLRFCHDRMQQAVYGLRDRSWRQRLQLAIARRFAQVGDDPVLRLCAAGHFAAAAALIVEPAERELARGLFLAAAVQTRQAGDFASAERYLRLGIGLLPEDAWQREPAAAFGLHAELHLVLYSQGRQDEADRTYERLASQPASLATRDGWLIAPTCIQIANLFNRSRYREAIALGDALLTRLGMPLPLADLAQGVEHYYAERPEIFSRGLAGAETPANIPAESALGQELRAVYRALAAGIPEQLPLRHELTDERLAGAARLMNDLLPAANSGPGHPILPAWLALRVVRLWIEDGYHPAHVYPTVCAGSILAILCGDYASAERLSSIALAVGAAREHGRETARARFIYAIHQSHWHHPLEENIAHAHQAHDELLRAGDLAFAGMTFYASQPALLDTCAHLDEIQAETEAALTFTGKTANTHSAQSYLPFRQLARALAGKTAVAGRFDDAEFDEPAYLTAVQGNPMARALFHTYRALAACLFGDEAALVQHAETAAGLCLTIVPNYATVLVNLLHSLALIQRFRDAPAGARAPLLSRLTLNQSWLEARAAAAPMNFGHLHELVEAERLDALDRPWEAAQAFESAMRQAQAQRRPWHLALITERAGTCWLRRGLEHAARPLLGRAHALYRQWGAVGKARALRAHLPFLNPGIRDHGGPPGGDDLDQLALLRASQTIASERSLPRLVARVASLVAELTGATDVQFLLLNETDSWQLEGGLRGSAALRRTTRQEAEAQGTIAASVLRLGLKTRVPLVSDDAVIDSRFCGDPHFAKLPLCSLLALPVTIRDRVGAFLILEHRLFRAAFTTAVVETATLLCRQLAVAIENVQLYRSLAARIAEREQELKAVYERLTAIEVEGARMAERERLIQDMHDGFGSQLASARLRIDHGEIAQGELAALLRECLDDLHLVVDTLGNEDKSLCDALADYRYRCHGRLSEYPVRIEWDIQLDASPPMDQRQILQILRILQESLNNALEHAHASLIRLQVIYRADGVLTMSVTDDGVGLPETIAYGRGLNNMQSRARDIGATLQYDRLDPGTGIHLSLPLDRNPVSCLQEPILPRP